MSCCDQPTLCQDTAATEPAKEPAGIANARIVDSKVKLLIAAGAALAANCEPCLKAIDSQLQKAGVPVADIRRAIQIGQFVKDKAAANMKSVAEVLTGVKVSDSPASVGCPAERMDSHP